MKEMVYETERKIEVLDTGFCFGYLYYILNLGTHPTAYVKIPEGHKYFGKPYGEIDIEVHGGLTFSEDYLRINKNQVIDGWFIGWDYAHYGDYIGYDRHWASSIENKKWTTEEIFKDVKDVCYQLAKMEENKNV